MASAGSVPSQEQVPEAPHVIDALIGHNTTLVASIELATSAAPFADVTPIIIKHCETVEHFLQNKPREPASSSSFGDAPTASLGAGGASPAAFGAPAGVAKEAAEKPKRGADDGDSDSSDDEDGESPFQVPSASSTPVKAIKAAFDAPNPVTAPAATTAPAYAAAPATGTWPETDALLAMAPDVLLNAVVEGLSKEAPVVSQVLTFIEDFIWDHEGATADGSTWTRAQYCGLLDVLLQTASRADAAVVARGSDADAQAVDGQGSAQENTIMHVVLSGVTTLLKDYIDEGPIKASGFGVEDVKATHRAVQQQLQAIVAAGHPQGTTQSEAKFMAEKQSSLARVLQDTLRALEDEDEDGCGVVTAGNTLPVILGMLNLAADGRVVQAAGPATCSVVRDGLGTLAAIIDAMSAGFVQEVPKIMPMLDAVLNNSHGVHACAAAVGLVSDLARAVGKDIIPFCDQLVGKFLTLLQAAENEPVFKGQVLGAMSDIVMCLDEGDQCLRYTPHILAAVATQAAITDGPARKEMDVDARNELREGCLTAYTGMFIAMKGTKFAMGANLKHLEPHLPFIFAYVGQMMDDVSVSDALVRTAADLLGDVASGATYLGKRRAELCPGVFDKVIAKGSASDDEDTVASAAYCRKKFSVLS